MLFIYYLRRGLFSTTFHACFYLVTLDQISVFVFLNSHLLLLTVSTDFFFLVVKLCYNVFSLAVPEEKSWTCAGIQSFSSIISIIYSLSNFFIVSLFVLFRYHPVFFLSTFYSYILPVSKLNVINCWLCTNMCI